MCKGEYQMAGFPIYRPRRLRATENLRSMIREVDLSVKDLIYPLFVGPGEKVKAEIGSLPGTYQWSVDRIMEPVDQVVQLGITAVILFGIPSYKDEEGSSAWDDEQPVQMAAKMIKKKYPELVVITDACFCEYTTHGHCGVLDADGNVDNDETLENLKKLAVSQAGCGADIIAPSNMMDGYVQVMRKALDEEGFEKTAIMAYSAKFASAYYGPFRDAAGSAPGKGNRNGYQMDPCNGNEAMREIQLDIEEGADIIIIKPAMSYLDICWRAHKKFNRPLCVYNVSGEYAMIKAASQNGWIDEKKIVLETMCCFKRAGAKMIITYFALEVARWLQGK